MLNEKSLALGDEGEFPHKGPGLELHILKRPWQWYLPLLVMERINEVRGIVDVQVLSDLNVEIVATISALMNRHETHC
jgi:hypothetical protein